jgi:hypothetical protein
MATQQCLEAIRSHHFRMDTGSRPVCANGFLSCGRITTVPLSCLNTSRGLGSRKRSRLLVKLDYWITSEWPTIRPECELGLGCMYSSPSARFSALHTSMPLGILKSSHATTACGAPSRSSDLNGSAPRPCKGRRIKRRIISCAQLGSRTYERTRTNQEVYYQPTGAKTQ